MWMKHFDKKEIAMKLMSEPEVINMSTGMFITAAIASTIASFVLQLKGQKEKSLWVGQWAPTILLFGLFDRMYKKMKLLKRF